MSFDVYPPQAISVGTGVGISAGTNLSTAGTVVFSNSNGVTFGMNAGGVVTASVVAGGGGGIANAAGTQTATSGTVVFSNSNNVTFGMSNSSVITASASQSNQTVASGGIAGTGFTTTTIAGSTVGGTQDTNGLKLAVPAYITTYAAQTNQTVASGNIAGTGFSSTTTAGTAIVGTNNTAGLSLGVPLYLTTQTVQTQASGAIAGSGFTSTTTGGVVPVATHNSAGLSMGIPNWITTYVAQTVQTQASGNIPRTGFSTTTTVGVSLVGTHDTNGLSLGVPNWITTYAAQTNQTVASGNIAGVGTTFGGTNVSGSMTLNSAGLVLSLSAPTPGGGGAINVSAGSTSGNLQTIVFSNSNGVSFGLNGSTVTASVAAAGGAAYTALTYQNRQLGASITIGAPQNSMFIVPMRLAAPVSASTIMQMISMSGVSTSNTGSVGVTHQLALYKVTGTNTSRFDTVWSTSMGITGFVSSSNSLAFTVDGGVSGQQFTTASANTNMTSQMSGIRLVTFNMNTIWDTGLYAFAFLVSTSSVGASAAIRSYLQIVDAPLNAGAGLGFGAATNSSIGYVDNGFYSASTAAFPASFGMSQIVQSNNISPYVKMGAI